MQSCVNFLLATITAADEQINHKKKTACRYGINDWIVQYYSSDSVNAAHLNSGFFILSKAITCKK
jgi:hypothetical protein